MTATTAVLDLVRRWAVAERNSGRFRVTVVAVRPAHRWLRRPRGVGGRRRS
jgi:hypothetical protein